MACATWMALYSYTPELLQSAGGPTLASIQTQVNNDGINCINTNQTFCGNFCKDVTKSEDSCYSCLSNPTSCPATFAGVTNTISCRTTTAINCNLTPDTPCCKTGCCPNAKSAVACAACVAASGQDINAFVSCYQPGGLSSTVLIIVIVCSIVGAAIIGASIYLAIRLRKKQQAQEKLVANLKARGVDQSVVGQVENINYAEVNPDIFRQVNRELALKN